MTLHILLSGSAHLPPQILPLLADGDAVLLLGDGVYLQAHFSSQAQLYLRQQDLQATRHPGQHGPDHQR